MDQSQIFQKLLLRQPLFEVIPPIAKPRICGTESEYGTENKEDGSVDIDLSRLPVVLPNGGELYLDCGHLEYASPETSNPLSATLYYEAGKVASWRGGYSPELYCHNTDWLGNTFGTHENYFTCARRDGWFQLVPFLIARTIFCGNGWLNRKNEFEISQRAQYITHEASPDTQSNRAVINLRAEPLASVPGWDRLHLICGDASMSEISTFLRIGATALVLEMLERNALPRIEYDRHCVEKDMVAISAHTSNWYLEGITYGPQSAVEILTIYLEHAKKIFSHRDSVTDTLLVIWEDTLMWLAKDPMKLWRRLDWVAKLKILNEFKAGVPEWDYEWLRSQDMVYHSLDPEKSLYYWLRQQGEMERLVSDDFIEWATSEPPRDTRAYLRGKLVQHLAEKGNRQVVCPDNWSEIVVVDRATGKAGRDAWFFHGECEPRKSPYLSQRIENPFKHYADLLPQIKRRLVS